MAVGRRTGRRVVYQVTQGVGVYVFWRDLDESLVRDASRLTYLMESIEEVFKVRAWCRHRIRQLFLIIKPIAVMTLKERSDAILRSGWFRHDWIKNNTWKQSQQSPRKHNTLPFARHKDSFSCFMMFYQTVLYTQIMTNISFNLSTKLSISCPN